MPVPKPRLDSYGQPLAPLVDAREELRYDQAFNVQQRRHLLANLEEQLRLLLRRGQYADVELGFRVENGIIQSEVHVRVVHHRRYERED